jgi:uncharacterized protein YbjT (DUF2867 family)
LPVRILLTGATGYVGGRLAPRLIAAGHDVRCLARDPARLAGRPWGRHEVVAGDASDPQSLLRALEGCHAAYYMIHSMTAGEHGFEDRDRACARVFADAARATPSLGRILYLGGLGGADRRLSSHLESRHEVGDILRTAGIPVTEFRAAVIVGSGSASFEMIRCLTERVPVMVCPRWVSTRCQPIAIRDVLRYLIDALSVEESAGRVLEIGGADVLTYRQMMEKYAEVRRLRRWIINVPVLTPRLSSYWVDLVTPIPAALARPLIEGLRAEVVVRDETARRLFPFVPLGYQRAVELALERRAEDDMESSWFDAYRFGARSGTDDILSQHEGMIAERRSIACGASPAAAFAQVARLGGDRGWLYADFLWSLRGGLDRIAGGPGMRRGRRSPSELRQGDAVDFWRVEEIRPPRLLRLRAEMRVPGRAWIQFEVNPAPSGCDIIQTAFFEPRGLSGQLYWWSLYPAHRMIFAGLLRRLAANAETDAAGGAKSP